MKVLHGGDQELSKIISLYENEHFTNKNDTGELNHISWPKSRSLFFINVLFHRCQDYVSWEEPRGLVSITETVFPRHSHRYCDAIYENWAWMYMFCQEMEKCHSQELSAFNSFVNYGTEELSSGTKLHCFAQWVSVINLVATFGAVYCTTTLIVSSEIAISSSLP